MRQASLFDPPKPSRGQHPEIVPQAIFDPPAAPQTWENPMFEIEPAVPAVVPGNLSLDPGQGFGRATVKPAKGRELVPFLESIPEIFPASKAGSLIPGYPITPPANPGARLPRGLEPSRNGAKPPRRPRPAASPDPLWAACWQLTAAEWASVEGARP